MYTMVIIARPYTSAEIHMIPADLEIKESHDASVQCFVPELGPKAKQILKETTVNKIILTGSPNSYLQHLRSELRPYAGSTPIELQEI